MSMETSTEILKPPTATDILWGALVLAWTSRRNKKAGVSLPEKIDQYTFVSCIKKSDHYGDMAIGVYEKEGQRYIVKRWQGEYKDFNYYFLSHEYFVTNIMTRVIREHPVAGVAIPEAVACVAESTSLSVVFQFIEGNTVSTLDTDKQITLWNKANDALEYLNAYLTAEDRRLIGTRGPKWYLILASGLSCLLLLFRPSRAKLVIRTWQTLVHLMRHLDARLVLNHRDLTPSNLLLGEQGTVYILDLEAMAVTLPGYDRAFVTVDPESSKIATALGPKTPTATYVFLRNYIVLHHILGSGSYLHVNEKYLEILNGLYSE